MKMLRRACVPSAVLLMLAFSFVRAVDPSAAYGTPGPRVIPAGSTYYTANPSDLDGQTPAHWAWTRYAHHDACLFSLRCLKISLNQAGQGSQDHRSSRGLSCHEQAEHSHRLGRGWHGRLVVHHGHERAALPRHVVGETGLGINICT